MQPEAAAASRRPASWHSGWHGSHGTPTTVSGASQGHTHEYKWEAGRAEEGTARQKASAVQGGEAEAAKFQRIMTEHQSSLQASSTAEADMVIQEARANTWQEQEAWHKVSRVNVCSCCMWWECLARMVHVRHVLVKSTWLFCMDGWSNPLV